MTLLYPLPLPANEAERLAYLRRVGKTTEDKKPALQALCESASRLFQVPIALVSLVEEHHQWFEARCGLSIDQTSREVSFCTHADRVPLRGVAPALAVPSGQSRELISLRLAG